MPKFLGAYILAFGSLLALPGFGHGTPAAELSWDDLIPDLQAFDDPFVALTPEQLEDLSFIAYFRLRERERPEEITQSSREDAEKTATRLKQQGIDIDGLLARRAEITAKRRARAEAVVEDLDGREVRMPGYLLPLDFEGDNVTEFLLVPVVGACIHVPPPPPNQMVHVNYDAGFASRGLYQAVWVNGVIKTESMNSDLTLVDGSAQVASGYSLQAHWVGPYE